MTILVKMLRSIEIGTIGQGDNFSQRKLILVALAKEITLARKKEHVGTFRPERHPSAPLGRNSPHIGTFQSGRHFGIFKLEQIAEKKIG